jgi:plastocyanin
MPRPLVVPLITAALLSAPSALVAAQAPASSVIERTPNMVNGWLSDPATVQFNFLHRFTESGAPEHQISNVPTFLVAGGLPFRTTAGFLYSTSSVVVPGRPNEWEFFGRVMPLKRDNPIADVSLHLGYNVGAASTDAELGLGRRVGPLRLLAAGRTFSNAFRAGERRQAVAGGVNLRVLRHLALAGDVGTMLERREDERLAWSAGIQMGIPTTPHSFSIHASNSVTGTLQGVSNGTSRTRYGFEYTVPITLARYFPSMRPSPTAPTVASRQSTDGGGHATTSAGTSTSGASGASGAGGDTVVVDMKQLAYEPARIEVKRGTIVLFTNNAPLPHTVSADDKSFDSGIIDIGKRWAHAFAVAGSYPFHCTPHPFMKGLVVVK